MTQTVQLRRVFRVVNGGTPTSDAENWDGEVRWATPVDLGRVHGGVLDRTARTLTETGLKSGSGLVPANSLLVSTRAPIGYVARVEHPTAFNQGCRGLVPRAEANLRFFTYQLVAQRSLLEAHGQGSTFAELTGDSLMALPLGTPPLKEQGALADYLDAETESPKSSAMAEMTLAMICTSKASSAHPTPRVAAICVWIGRQGAASSRPATRFSS